MNRRASRASRASPIARPIARSIALLIALLVALVPARAAGAQAGDGTPSLQLVRPAAAVQLGEEGTIVVKVAGAPADAQLDLVVFTAVDEQGVVDALSGRLPDRRVGFLPRAPVDSLVEPDGTATLAFRAVADPPKVDEEIRMGDPGLYPVRVRLVTAGGRRELAGLLTFVVRPIPGRTLPVALVLPVDGAPSLKADGTTAPAAADVERLRRVTQFAQARPTYPFTFAPRPELLAAVARGSRGESSMLDSLSTALADRQVLSRPFVRLDLPGMAHANLGSEIANQLAVGERVVGETLVGVRPDRRVWLADGPLDATTLATLGQLGVQALLTGAGHLRPVAGAAARQPVALISSEPGLPLQALVTEPGLAAGLQPAATSDRSDAARALVLRLVARAFGGSVGEGALLVPEAGWSVDVAFLEALADEISTSVMLRAVTLDGYLRATTPDRTTERQIVDDQVNDLTRYAQGLFVTRVAIDHLTSALPRSTRLFDGMANLTLMAGSADLTPAGRQAYLDAVNTRLKPARLAISTEIRPTVTLAGRTGTLPVTITNDYTEPLSIKLRLVSSKLTVTDNDRIVTVPANGQTTVEIPVEARTSAWRFPVQVTVLTPSGDDEMAPTATFDLRVVGLSGLGIGVSATLALVLLSWWVTHVRRRRRARRRGGTSDGTAASGTSDGTAASDTADGTAASDTADGTAASDTADAARAAAAETS